ncbi:MAG: VOC family protein [Vicinamibacterales bacterium]
MKIEHTAFQVVDPAALSRWYVEHLGLTIKRAQKEPPFGHFLADDGNSAMLEFYRNPTLAVPDYHAVDPLALHLAFVVDDVAATFERLRQAGASAETEMRVLDNGDCIAMLRDPGGLPLQLVSRTVPMVERR